MENRHQPYDLAQMQSLPLETKIRMTKGGSAVAYAWFIWEKGYKGEPVVRWFN